LYTVPANGVVVSWKHKANLVAGRELGLRMFRLVGGTTYTLVGSSGVQTLTPNVTNSFATRIPVKAGDRLGLYVGNPGSGIPPDVGGGASCAFAGSAGDLLHEGPASPEPAVGSNTDLSASYANIYRLNLTASVEPDADGDGYGDETQDGCPASATAQTSCPAAPKDTTPPGAAFSSRRDSVKDNAVSFAITANEAATATVTGTVNVPNASKTYRLRHTTASLQKGVSKKLTLRIAKKARKPIKRALRRHQKLNARLTVILKDAAGNTATLRSTVSLRR
jgi:hypothetical protein